MAKKEQIAAVAIFMGVPVMLVLAPRKVDTSEDGIYCAEVEYYNPKTGTESTYTLPVEVEDEQLIKINFPNGGWLDESHFEREYIDEGKVEFTSDEGKKYKVELLYDGKCD